MPPSSPLRGYAAGFTAFFLWGVFPVYWKALHGVDAAHVTAYRALFSLPVVLALLAWRREWPAFSRLLRSPRMLGTHLLTASLLGANWLIFIYATQHGQVVAASLGYFLNPLVNVLIGAAFLGERMRRGQWLAVGLATVGVAFQVVVAGHVPWISLGLVSTFAAYGVLRKFSRANALEGLALETIVAIPAVLLFFGWHAGENDALTWQTWALLAACGVVTTGPLLAFAAAARSIPLGHLGLLQFVAPTLQFLLGWLVYGETQSAAALGSFAFIGTGLAVFVWDSLRANRRLPAVPVGKG